MNSLLGRSVRLFLVDGTASGLTTAEIMNWTGHVLTGSRSGLPVFLKRPELDRTGIYFLTGPDPEDPDVLQLYVGESDNVRKRLVQHNKNRNKDFWERTCVVTSKDQNITKAHARYLEARLIAIANAVGTATVVNGSAAPPVPLPEADASDMEFFVDQLQLIFPVLGLDFLRQPQGHGADDNRRYRKVRTSRSCATFPTDKQETRPRSASARNRRRVCCPCRIRCSEGLVEQIRPQLFETARAADQVRETRAWR